jgi:DNA-directed RNA polymerase specialized sigma24 family protein
MAAARDGAVDRLGELFDRHAGALHSFFTRRTGDAQESEDLVQETFLRVLRYRASWRGYVCFAGWLYRLAVNLERDRR